MTIDILHGKLTKDGEPFVPKGMIFTFPLLPISLFDMPPDNDFEADYIEKQIAARDFYYGRESFLDSGALPMLLEWGVDTIRFNLFEGALDIANELYSSDYADDVKQMVGFARQLGFIVILCLFDAGNKQTDPDAARRPPILFDSAPGKMMATGITLRAFRKLARMFGQDTGVILETLNEPYCGWNMWLDGGTKNGERYFGVNDLITIARQYGSRNVILCCGPGASFADFPGGVRDKLDLVAYSIHPFFSRGVTPADWDRNFGELAAVQPVILSAWSCSPKDPWCTPDTLNAPLDFLNYLEQRSIGIVGFAFDMPGTVVQGLNGRPTKWPMAPGMRGGPGELLQIHFHAT
jgi:hypothetical protein